MLSDLKSCKTLYDVSTLLDIPAKHLSFLLYILPEGSRYTKSCLSKKCGGTREILIPNRRLKILQRRLSEVLYECVAELDETHGPRRSFGFEVGRDIFDNAAQHLRRRWLFNVDLADFFPSINFGRVISYFQKNSDFALEPKVATIISQIACHENQLPQGAPSSPVISNLIAGSLDYRLAKLAKKARCNYSRYADDITFSTNEKTFPELVAVQDGSSQGWSASEELVGRIQASGFDLNDKKTRMSYRDSRQMVTGLVVNQRPNVPREAMRTARATVHRMMRGKDWHLSRFTDPFGWNCEGKKAEIDDFAALEGRLSHIFRIRDRADNRDPSKKFFRPQSSTLDYANLLYFKYFVRGEKPIIITEGVSDILYIKAALRAHDNDIDGFLEYNPIDKNTILTDFFRFPEHAGRVMALTGGTGSLGVFFERYGAFLRRLSTNVPRRPVIIFVDNDTGLEGITKAVKEQFKVMLSSQTDEPFTKLSDSVYLVRTPHKGTKTKTSSEDFLDPTALSQVLGGKTFSSKSKYDTNKHFGKFILSSHVYENHNIYSFDDFKPILARFSAAVKDI